MLIIELRTDYRNMDMKIAWVGPKTVQWEKGEGIVRTLCHVSLYC